MVFDLYTNNSFICKPMSSKLETPKGSIDDATPEEWDKVAKKIREQREEDFLDIYDQLEMFKDNGEYGS